MQHNARLFTVYRRVEPYLYGAVSIVEPEAFARGGTIPLDWSYPYVVSKQLEDKEIVYGSIVHLIGEVAKPIFRMNHRIDSLAERLPEETRASAQVTRTHNAIIYQLPGPGFPEWFLHQWEELGKEGLLLSGLHLRTLLEILSGGKGTSIGLYDYEDNLIKAISLNELFNTLMHHRYCVISGEYVHDIFSGDSNLESPRLFGSKVKVAELFTTILSYLSRITVKDFVGVLRGRLESLTINSEPRDIIFAVQNVHSLAEIVGDRIADGRFSKVQDLLFRDLTAEEKRRVEEARRESKTIQLARRFRKPSFGIDPELHEKRIAMAINIM